MARILTILPQTDFDPTEVAFPWLVWKAAGHAVVFATETGSPAACDPVTLTGAGLPALDKALRARPEARDAYAAMLGDPAYRQPLRWADARAADYAALHFPGGHAPGMRPYCESDDVHRLAREAFAADQVVSAICHGVLPLARAGVLAGRQTTSLTGIMEQFSILVTSRALPGHYRTYPESVETEVRRSTGPTGNYERGPVFLRYAAARSAEAGFVVQDGNYLSARWPGDAWTLALRMNELLV